MVGMSEMPLQVRNKWKHETKFVLKRVGQDPSWRARLGNLMSFSEEQENEALGLRSNNANDNNEEVDEEEGKEFPSNADHFLVCVFNVSSKVSYRYVVCLRHKGSGMKCRQIFDLRNLWIICKTCRS